MKCPSCRAEMSLSPVRNAWFCGQHKLALWIDASEVETLSLT